MNTKVSKLKVIALSSLLLAGLSSQAVMANGWHGGGHGGYHGGGYYGGHGNGRVWGGFLAGAVIGTALTSSYYSSNNYGYYNSYPRVVYTSPPVVYTQPVYQQPVYDNYQYAPSTVVTAPVYENRTRVTTEYLDSNGRVIRRSTSYGN